MRSAKTAVICAKPLRENERVDSSPGMPASAVSSATVTCFSISTGVSAGAVALIWTWTLVTSGTASIGSFVSDQKPDAAAASVTSRTSHRRRTEKSTIRSIIVQSSSPGFDSSALSENVFDTAMVSPADSPETISTDWPSRWPRHDVALLEAVLGADEHDLAALEPSGWR